MKALKASVEALIVLAGIGVYTLRSFHPEQPLHHEFNDAGGVLVVAFIVVWCFFPSGDDK